MKNLARIAATALTIVASGAVSSSAEDVFPSRLVKIISPYSPGGTPDIVARILAEQLSASLKQSFIVENRTGANGTIASEYVASSPPDGYTLLLGSDGPIIITPLLFAGTEDPLKRLIPINLSVESAFVLMARTELDVNNLQDVVALGKKQSLTFGSSGVGSQHHLAAELLKDRAGIKLDHIPYKGFGQAVSDLIGNRIDLLYGGIPAALQFISNKQVRPIAVTSDVRSPKLPDVPTFQESGFPGYKVAFWAGIMAPAQTPDAVVSRLNTAITAALNSEKVRTAFEKIGVDPLNLGPADFAKRIKADKLLWGDLIKQANLKQN